MKGVARDVNHPDVRGVDPADDPHRLEAVLDEIVWVRIDSDVDALTLEDRHQLFHGSEERPLGFLRAFRPAGELGVDDVDPEVDGDLDDALPVSHRSFAGVLIRARPSQHRQHRGDADAGVGAGLAELGHQIVVGTRVVVERDEVPVRRELQVLVAQFGYHTRKFEQLEVVMEWRGIQGDLHRQAPLIESRATMSTVTGCPVSNDSTPAAHTAAAA